jgi:hypothetical protein
MSAARNARYLRNVRSCHSAKAKCVAIVAICAKLVVALVAHIKCAVIADYCERSYCATLILALRHSAQSNDCHRTLTFTSCCVETRTHTHLVSD